MAARRTGNGRFLLDTGEWEALKDEVVQELKDEVQDEKAGRSEYRTPKVEIPLRPAESSDVMRAIALEVYDKKREDCITNGPVGQLTRELRELREELKNVTTQVRNVQGDLQTTSRIEETRDRAFVRRLTLWVGGSTIVGVLANLFNILWTLAHRGH